MKKTTNRTAGRIASTICYFVLS